MKLIYNILLNTEYRAKRDTLYRLRCLSHRQLLDCGISPELLNQGIKAWPWKETPENLVPLPLPQSPQRTKVIKGADMTKVTDEEKDTSSLYAA